MSKKILSILLSLCILVGVLTILPISAYAQDTDVAELGAVVDIAETAGDDYPYSGGAIDVVDRWNFYTRECTSFCAWRLNNNNGVAFTNSYGGVRWGNAGNWINAAQSIGITVDNNPAIGSIACWTGGQYGHVAWVSGVDGDSVYIEEYNYNYAYSYGTRTINRYNPSGYIHIKDLGGNTLSFTPVDIGTDFYANILNLTSSKCVAVSGFNVQLADTNGDDWQKWRFERQSDASYKITNVATGYCLDVSNADSANETNIQVVYSNDTNAQRWYFKAVDNGYSLIPKCAMNSCLDIHNGDLSSGSNIQLFQQNATNAQIFDIRIQPSFIAQNLGDTFTAAIIFNATGNAVTVLENNNVGVWNYTGADNQLWRFERQNNRSYKITNLATGLCLDDENYGTADKTNIQVCSSNNSYAQRWFFKAVNGSFSLAPQSAPKSCIDSYDGGSQDGMNIYLWTQNSTNAQIISLKYMLTPAASEMYSGNKYELYNVSLPWKEASRFCEQQGGHLVTVSSQEEQDFVVDFIKTKSRAYVWLGATDMNNEGVWKWVTEEEFSYSNWAVNEPNNNNNEDYLMIYKNSGEWNDATDIYTDNSVIYSFVCEYEHTSILGDVDDDGEVGIIDATYIQRYDAGFDIPISEEDILLRGDVDGDEEVTVIDATYIQRFDAGFNIPYPVGEAIA